MADELARYQKNIEAFASRLLADYTTRVRNLPRAPGLKEFNDPIWGTLTLLSLEVLVLDSPLVQRLRRIRQLGVVHFVYPGATHTRLEHSLGVIHQIQRLVDAINETSGQSADVIDVSTARLLRLTALCHDVGHGLMSHVSENALDSNEAVEDIKLAFADQLYLESARLSEMAAYFMIGSPAFRDLVLAAQVIVTDHSLPPDAVNQMQRAVVGSSISKSMPMLHELISGPFDADKLDYMTRDAHMTGVPIVTDIPRLVQKVRAVTMAGSALPPELAARVEQGPAVYTMLGVAHSGGRTLDELMLGRTLLFDKIYRHHKVRAAEAMVATLLGSLVEVAPSETAILPLLIPDEAALDITRELVSSMTGGEPPETASHAVEVAVDMSRRLRERALFVRCFAFAQKMPFDPYADEMSQRLGLERMLRDLNDVSDRLIFTADLASEIRLLLEIVGQQALLSVFPGSELHGYVAVDPPQQNPVGDVIARAYLVTHDRRLVRFREDFAESRAWADAYLLTRDTGYVFAPAELAPYAFLAAQKLVRDRYGVRIPSSMLTYAKQSEDVVNVLRGQAAEAGYYKDGPRDLLPIPQRLLMADIPARVAEIVVKLSEYAGPISNPETMKQGRLLPEQVIDWVRQFEDPELVEPALSVVQAIRIVGRAEITRGLDAFLSGHPEFHGAVVCGLGGAKDSASLAAYFAQDLAERYSLTVETADRLHHYSGRRAVFVDDFIVSGGQAISILESWLDADRTVELDEYRGEPLPAEGRQILQEGPIAVCFAAGASEGMGRLTKRAGALGVSIEGHIEVAEDELPRAFGAGVVADPELEKRLRDKCVEIGAAVLTDPSVGHDEGWARDRALGYGGKALLVASPFNTPTHTLTAIWSSGPYDGSEWLPLLPRRKKT